jgi:hypothetical protein
MQEDWQPLRIYKEECKIQALEDYAMFENNPSLHCCLKMYDLKFRSMQNMIDGEVIESTIGQD